MCKNTGSGLSDFILFISMNLDDQPCSFGVHPIFMGDQLPQIQQFSQVLFSLVYRPRIPTAYS